MILQRCVNIKLILGNYTGDPASNFAKLIYILPQEGIVEMSVFVCIYYFDQCLAKRAHFYIYVSANIFLYIFMTVHIVGLLSIISVRLWMDNFHMSA